MTVEGALSQAIQVSNRDLAEPLELLTTKQFVFPFEDRLCGRSVETLMSVIHLNQQDLITKGELGGKAVSLVGAHLNLSSTTELIDQTSKLSGRDPCYLLQLAAYEPFLSTRAGKILVLTQCLLYTSVSLGAGVTVELQAST